MNKKRGPEFAESDRAAFIAAARDIARQRLVVCGSGNLSWRIDHDRFLITAAGAWMSELTKEGVVVCRLVDEVFIGKTKPSLETALHRLVLRQRRDINVVLHFQSPCATALACSAKEITDYFVIPEIPFYIGPVTSVSYCDPGSEELARAVASALEDHDLVQLENHGQVTVGRDFRETLQKAAFFEVASGILLASGGRSRTLSPGAVESLLRLRRRAGRQSSV